METVSLMAQELKNQFQNSYPGLLSQLLGEGYDVRNFGISARVLLNKGDHPYMHEQKFRDLFGISAGYRYH